MTLREPTLIAVAVGTFAVVLVEVAGHDGNDPFILQPHGHEQPNAPMNDWPRLMITSSATSSSAWGIASEAPSRSPPVYKLTLVLPPRA